MIKNIAIENQTKWHYAPMIKLLTTQKGINPNANA